MATVIISTFQRELLRKVNAQAKYSCWYLDLNTKERAALRRLEARGLVTNTGEGQGRWRVFWEATEAGKALTQ